MATDYLMNRDLRLALLDNPAVTLKTVSDSVLREIIDDTTNASQAKVIALHNAAVLESAERWQAYERPDLSK